MQSQWLALAAMTHSLGNCWIMKKKYRERERQRQKRTDCGAQRKWRNNVSAKYKRGMAINLWIYIFLYDSGKKNNDEMEIVNKSIKTEMEINSCIRVIHWNSTQNRDYFLKFHFFPFKWGTITIIFNDNFSFFRELPFDLMILIPDFHKSFNVKSDI